MPWIPETEEIVNIRNEEEYRREHERVERLISRLEEMYGKIGDARSQGATVGIDTGRLRFEFERFGRDFVSMVSTSFQREMNQMFEGGNLPGLGQASETAGRSLGSMAGQAFGAYVGGPAGAAAGRVIGEAAGAIIGNVFNQQMEGFRMLGAQRAPALLGGQFPTEGLNPSQFSALGREYQRSLAAISRITGETNTSLDATFQRISRLGVAFDERGKQALADAAGYDRILNLQKGTSAALQETIVKQYGEDISEAAGALTNLRTYTAEWQMRLDQSNSATAKAFISAQTLAEALAQVESGARMSGGTLEDLRATGQNLLMMLEKIGRPDVVAAQATQMMQAIQPGMENDPMAEVKKGVFFYERFSQFNEASRNELSRLREFAKKEGILGAPGVPISEEDFRMGFSRVYSVAKSQKAIGAGGDAIALGSLAQWAFNQRGMTDFQRSLALSVYAREMTGAQLGPSGAQAMLNQARSEGIDNFVERLSRGGLTEEEKQAYGMTESQMRTKYSELGDATLSWMTKFSKILQKYSADIGNVLSGIKQAVTGTPAERVITNTENIVADLTRKANAPSAQYVGGRVGPSRGRLASTETPAFGMGGAMAEEEDPTMFTAPEVVESTTFMGGEVQDAAALESLRRHGVSQGGGSAQHP